jgi:DNA-binding transcriptional LysR family regulator
VDLIQLRYFRAIAQSKSMTAAAKMLGVSQPTLTGALQKLEESLRTALFFRERHGMTLTSTGQALLRHADGVFEALALAERDIRGLQDEEQGHFVVGCHESLGAYFLPGFLKPFLERQPQIVLTLWNGTSAAVQDAVIGRQVDLGLVVNPRPHPDLVLVPLFRDAVDFFVLDAPADSLEVAHRRLREGPIVFASRIFQCQELLERLAAESLLSSRALNCGDLELVKSLALSGVGVAMLPRRVAAYGHAGKLQRLHPELPCVHDTIVLIHRADLPRTRAAKVLKGALTAHGQSLSNDVVVPGPAEQSSIGKK